MSDIAAFLEARLDEREAIALAAQGTTRGAWTQIDPDREPGRIEDDYGDVVTYDESSPDEGQARHIAANDPAHVLADIAAKRKLINRYRNAEQMKPEMITTMAMFAYYVTMQDFAVADADHPDYDESWRP